jgi:hypothetical protein
MAMSGWWDCRVLDLWMFHIISLRASAAGVVVASQSMSSDVQKLID